jgi:hypothetical protein
VAGWFSSGKIDHPLAEPKDSRKTISELPQDAFKALGEVAYWLESVHATDGFDVERRFELIDEFDQYARPRLRKLAQDYLQVRQQKFQENRLWVAQSDFWRLAGSGYVQCAEAIQADAPGAGALRSRVPVIVARALRALGQQLKWSMLRYGPADATAWASIGRMYAYAQSKGFADKAVALYDAGAGESSARHEFLRIVMLSAASVDSMTPEQVEIAERSVALFARHFLLEDSPEAGCTHVFDIAGDKPPTRPHGASMEASMRYFGAGPALEEIDRLRRILVAEGALPSDVNLGGEYDPKSVAEVWRHVLQYWALSPPERGSDRQPVNVALTVVRGLANIIASLEPAMSNSLDFGPEGSRADAESWTAVNVSDGGYGAIIPGSTKSDTLQIGSLLGLKAEGERYWSVGVVRRLTRDADLSRHVGIELLTRAALAMRVAPTGAISAANAVRDDEPAVLLTRHPDGDRQIRILMRAGCYTQEQQLELRVRGQVYRVRPVRILENAIEFDHGEFSVRERKS